MWYRGFIIKTGSLGKLIVAIRCCDMSASCCEPKNLSAPATASLHIFCLLAKTCTSIKDIGPDLGFTGQIHGSTWCEVWRTGCPLISTHNFTSTLRSIILLPVTLENSVWPISLMLKSTGGNLSNKAVQSLLCLSDNTACNTISVSAAGVAEDTRHLSWETISCELQRRTMISMCAHGWGGTWVLLELRYWSLS